MRTDITLLEREREIERKRHIQSVDEKGIRYLHDIFKIMFCRKYLKIKFLLITSIKKNLVLLIS